jgi:hypothetical protein
MRPAGNVFLNSSLLIVLLFREEMGQIVQEISSV